MIAMRWRRVGALLLALLAPVGTGARRRPVMVWCRACGWGPHKSFVYDLDSGGRLPERDIAVHDYPASTCSAGTTMWVADGAVDSFAAQSLGGRRSVAGALTGWAASVASAAAALAIATAVSSRFATSASGQPEVCDYTLQVHDAIVAPADVETCSYA